MNASYLSAQQIRREDHGEIVTAHLILTGVLGHFSQERAQKERERLVGLGQAVDKQAKVDLRLLLIGILCKQHK